MITDEQVNRAIAIIKQAEYHNVRACLDEFKKIGQHAIPPEVFVRQLLEDYEKNRWVSVADRLPQNDGFYLTDDGLCYYHFDNAFEEDDYWVYAHNPEESADVTLWQPLSTFKD